MKIDRKKVYDKCNGHCGYCGSEIKYKDMQIDHIFPKRLDGMFDYGGIMYDGDIDSFDNLMPSCRTCNHYKRAYLLENFRKLMKTLHERLLKIYIFRIALKYGIVEIKNFDGEFYFEKLTKNNKQ